MRSLKSSRIPQTQNIALENLITNLKSINIDKS
jgi:hypothetical protein